MKWSWKLFTAFGIGVYVHATFLLLLLFIFFAGFASSKDHRITHGLATVLLLVCLFGCVLLHEFGHALTAKRFGVKTRDIILLPIGGVARLERIPSDPRQEFLIAAAGPPVNLVIAGVLYLIQLAAGPGEAPVESEDGLRFLGSGFLTQLINTNLFIAFFNLIPAFPMDGGRILRALLATRLDYVRATKIAVSIGQALAFGLGLLGLLGNPILILVAFFIYIGAGQEGLMVQYRHAFRGLPTSVAMMTTFNSLTEDDRLEKAVEYLLQSTQSDFPVMRDHTVVGLLTRSALIDALGKNGPQAQLRTATVKPVKVLTEDLPLDLAYEAIQTEGVPCLPVMRDGTLVGLISMENLAEFAMVTEALHGRRPVPRVGTVA